MGSYGIFEFAQLLGLGLWDGGTIQGLGYASPALETDDGMPSPGLTGLYLGGGVMLEGDHPDGSGMQRLSFSVYDPYSGGYRFYRLSAGFTQEGLGEALREGGADSVRKPRPRAYTPLRDKRRYVAEHTNYRSGAIPVPRRWTR